jgi:hypothetical protein
MVCICHLNNLATFLLFFKPNLYSYVHQELFRRFCTFRSKLSPACMLEFFMNNFSS